MLGMLCVIGLLCAVYDMVDFCVPGREQALAGSQSVCALLLRPQYACMECSMFCVVCGRSVPHKCFDLMRSKQEDRMAVAES